MARDAGLDTLASLLKVDRGGDGRYRIRLSDEAKRDCYISGRIIVGGVPPANGNDKREDDDK